MYAADVLCSDRVDSNANSIRHERTRGARLIELQRLLEQTVERPLVRGDLAAQLPALLAEHRRHALALLRHHLLAQLQYTRE